MGVELVQLLDCMKVYGTVPSTEFSLAEQSDYNFVLHILCTVALPCRTHDNTMCSYIRHQDHS
jgi:hypothetical protein